MLLIDAVVCPNCSWEVPDTPHCLNCGKPLNATHDSCFCGKEHYHGKHRVKGKLALRCSCGFSATTQKELKEHLDLIN